MIEYAFITVVGVLAGVFTGLIPGIHPNTVIFGSMPFYLSTSINFNFYMCFIAGLSVSHTFHDFIPAIFLGAPEAESALSALPGARMVLDGEGLKAFQYTVVGGVVSVTAVLLFLPVLFNTLPLIYGHAETFMPYILAFFLFFILFRSDNMKHSAVILFLSGALGVLSFRSPVNQQFVLMPVFSGLFALPSLIFSLKHSFDIPEQRNAAISVRDGIRGGTIGAMAGLIAGVVPGIGSATSTSFLSPLLDSETDFLAGMGGVNTADIIVSFLALYLIESSRSGASVALQALSEIDVQTTVFLGSTSLFAVGLSAVIALKISGKVLNTLSGLDMRPVLIAVTGVIVGITIYLTGFLGLLVLLTSSCIGYAAVIKSERVSCMAVLLVPAILFYTSFLSV